MSRSNVGSSRFPVAALLLQRAALALVFGLGITVVTSAPALAGGNVQAGKEDSKTCAACHGADGNSSMPMFPSIAGQPASYLAEQLHAFRDGKRVNALMSPQAKALTDQQIADLAAYFAAQKRIVKSPAPASADSIPGAHLWRFGGHDNTVAACAACHGTHGQGNQPAGFPALRGLTPQYITESLMAYRKDARKTEHANIMVSIASKLSDDDIKDLAQHIATFH